MSEYTNTEHELLNEIDALRAQRDEILVKSVPMAMEYNQLKKALASAQAQNAALVAAMGEEWPMRHGYEQTNDDFWRTCEECRRWKTIGHTETCTRGRFFALAPDAGKGIVEAMRLAKAVIVDMRDYLTTGDNRSSISEIDDALAALSALGGEA